ncbi:hypothetical protein N7508_004666 [Penicillium antarcticum]|uniref:uncharacterized protein n=1 Tax=Penicillium antarcticum TaxID=416450 RepID=UPI002393E4DC|nr:uncharacterized protein N7508_004666 [Penicillium antarcticum]KAJ5305651.1 hypothetical protein N7508_004666 [Penicillium antarcticum]
MLSGYTTPTKQPGCRQTWEDWVFAESKLRTAIVYFILASCYDVDYGLPCDRDIDHEFGEIELPATKSLWEAIDEISWYKILDLAISGQDRAHPVESSETRLNYTNLVELNKFHSGPECRATMECDLGLKYQVEKWYKEMDELGMLVSLCSVMSD